MSTRKLVVALVAAVASGPVLAQDEAGAPRTVAALPEELPGTGEPAPPPPPRSSAASPGSVDPGAGEFGIGHPASDEEIASIDIDVMPDGSGLPEGSGTFAEGETLYAERCSACHGENLEGIAELGAPALIGGRDTLASGTPLKTVESYWPYASTLFDYIHRTMPMDLPGSLGNDEVYAICTYILARAGLVGEDAELDAESFAEIAMPNAEGFAPDPRPGSE